MKLFSKKKEAPDAEPQEKPDMIDYLNSLPEVEVPFKPFEEDPPVAVPEKTDAQRLADEIRQQSKAAELVPLAALKHAHEDWDALKPALESAEDCKDIAGLIAFLTPRFVIFCVLCLLLAAFLLLVELTTIFDWLPGWLHNASSLFFFLPLFVWYIVFINKAAKRFW